MVDRRVVLALLAVLPLAACATPDAPAEKSGSGERRTDLDPLTRRFPALTDPVAPVSAVWFSGTTGSDLVPGPSTYWIDAVVTLDPATADRLASAHDLAPTTDTPDVVEDLVDDLPAGDLLAAASLDEALTVDGFGVRGWLDVAGGRLVLSALGEGV